MGKKCDEIVFNEFRQLLIAGAVWVSMNVENHFDPSDGLRSHLRNFSKENCLVNPGIEKVWSSLKYVYLKEGLEGLMNIISGNYDFDFLWLSEIKDFQSIEEDF
ncbi:hypothetical protein [Pseudoalteromonas sp. CH_XMU1449-3]|uniref:hypothetical protein n=1 Tax=Pseudoalteromonas sp. CH_XMU1449-3 TaxID=3107774 RepID=UPI003008EEA0